VRLHRSAVFSRRTSLGFTALDIVGTTSAPCRPRSRTTDSEPRRPEFAVQPVGGDLTFRSRDSSTYLLALSRGALVITQQPALGGPYHVGIWAVKTPGTAQAARDR
jgi:hypothetical protein